MISIKSIYREIDYIDGFCGKFILKPSRLIVLYRFFDINFDKSIDDSNRFYRLVHRKSEKSIFHSGLFPQEFFVIIPQMLVDNTVKNRRCRRFRPVTTPCTALEVSQYFVRSLFSVSFKTNKFRKKMISRDFQRIEQRL